MAAPPANWSMNPRETRGGRIDSSGGVACQCTQPWRVGGVIDPPGRGGGRGGHGRAGASCLVLPESGTSLRCVCFLGPPHALADPRPVPAAANVSGPTWEGPGDPTRWGAIGARLDPTAICWGSTSRMGGGAASARWVSTSGDASSMRSENGGFPAGCGGGNCGWARDLYFADRQQPGRVAGPRAGCAVPRSWRGGSKACRDRVSTTFCKHVLAALAALHIRPQLRP